MNFIKTSFWSGISTTVRILAGIITTKIMAIYIGPTGVALLGNFTNITTILSTFANGAIGSGITKYISEFDSEEDKQNVVSHAFMISITCSFLIGIAVLIFHNALAKLAFGDTKYSTAFIIFGFTVIFFGLNTTISAVLNGYRQIKYLIMTGMTGSILSVILAFIITIKFGVFGALINSAIAQICIFMINLHFSKRLNVIEFKMGKMSIDTTILCKLFKYAGMSIVSVLLVPTGTLMIRKYVFNHFTPNEAGYIQGVWSISNAYLMVVTTALSIYYLPTLSSIKDDMGLKNEIFKGYKFLLPMAILGGTAVYICRDLIIHVLYTPEFLPMKKYFLFQIIGDTLKISSWILGYLMVAKAMTIWFIATEVIFTGIYISFAFVFMNYYGSIGVTYAYSLNYFIFLIYLIVIFRKLLFKNSTIST
ncbi:MAG: O-antigen translocase [Peptococcaceae bacterium]|nr:O-antigen translocase [Peptococcaceae bacterium]